MASQQNKLLYVSLTNSAGGAEQILCMAAKVTKSKLIFLKKVSSSAILINEKYPRVKFLNKYSIFLGFILLLKELFNHRSDYIIISSHPYLNAYLGVLKRIGFLKSKLITRECTSVFLRFSGLKRKSYQLAYLLGYPAIDLFVCQTNEMKKQLIDNLSFIKEAKVLVQQNPVDVDLLFQKAEVSIEDEILSESFICSAGRLIPLKGFDNLITAFAEIAADFEGLKLIILGEGSERAYLEKLIKDLKLEDRIILKGFVNNPFPYFKSAKVCVVSSIREGFPNVLLQMMALNNSVVSTLCADGIDNFKSVRRVGIDNIPALAEAIRRELQASPPTNFNCHKEYILNRTPGNFISSILNSVHLLS